MGYAQTGSFVVNDDSTTMNQYQDALKLDIKKTVGNNADSGVSFVYFYKFSCKGNYFNGQFIPAPPTIKQDKIVTAPIPASSPKFLTIHGNISYDFYYRSKIDTPISQQDFQQHTERVYLDIMLKEKFPLKVGFTSRQSNSPFFKDFSDVNFRFDRPAYTKNIRQDLINKIAVQLPQRPDLKAAEAELKEKKTELHKLKGWLGSSSTLQKIIEEREKQYKQRLDSINKTNDVSDSLATKIDFRKRHQKPGADSIVKAKEQRVDSVAQAKEKMVDSLVAKQEKKYDSLAVKYEKKIDSTVDSLSGKFAKFYNKEAKRIDSLQAKIDQLQKRTDSLKNIVQKDILKAKQQISKISSEKDLKKIAAGTGIKLDSVSKFQQNLLAVKSFSIGRSMIDYTELTAQNITITGLNVEYNPSWYAAVAVGKIDYRFRDFFNKNIKNNNQYLLLGRIGIGDKEKKALIFTVFQGRKSQSQFALSDTVANHVNVLGYSVEAIYKLDNYTGISAEVAKSTIPTTGAVQTNKQLGALWNFSDKSNLGVNIKGQTFIPETNTKLSGFYRKTGERFQSFSLFSYNTDQVAWLARIDQSFYKNRVSVTGMLRRNDFTNPFTDKTYKTSTVFKSVLLNIRFPKYPAVSIGYYPGTQLYVVNKELIRENAYYILNASAVYGYHVNNIGMNSSIVYNQYYNQSTDSGFVLYKGLNYYISQSVFLNKLQIQGAYSVTKQPELKYYTLESSADYAIRPFLKIGAGAKFNHVNSGADYWGERLMVSADFKKLGGLQIQYEKSYLPTLNQTLYPVEIGRISWYKIF